tara:strand:- start:376 stop:732 length:357 start_codon:yes stop_codon:yes gene_type:complete
MSTPPEASIIHGQVSCSSLAAGPWQILSNGHLIPSSNASFDIGNAEYKVRHLFLSDNSLQIGDTTLSENNIKQNMRVVARIPTSPGDTGLKGDVAHDSDYIYFCFDDNTWTRITKSHW